MLQQGNGKIKGQADLEAKTVLINSLLQSQDTLPHEYAHHYIRMFINTPIVKEAIKKWGSEEALVQAIGEQAVKQRGEAWDWWSKFSKWVKSRFNSLGKIGKEEIKNVLTDAFLSKAGLQGIEPSVDAAERLALSDALDSKGKPAIIADKITVDGLDDKFIAATVAETINKIKKCKNK
jgi:energy-converting hydrogenase A subunit M